MQKAIVLIRILVGWVFLVEGYLKFALPQELGIGRFTATGIPYPQYTAPFVAVVEIVCGCLILVGFATRFAAIALLIDMIVALLSTKVPILLGEPYWIFSLPNLKHYGVLSMLHEARTDISMLLGLLFLIIAGSGEWSVDAMRNRRK